ncbi:MAG: HAMP domain-containing histidine kinase [Anaerolineae bacterium]|nr:HAMP domain-containing histidine kinase [Anaerolineae bacterium]
MQNLSLRTRLLAWLFLPVIILVVITTGALAIVNGLGREFKSVAERDLALVNTLDEIKFYGARVISSTNELILDYAIGRDNLGQPDQPDENSTEVEELIEAKDNMWVAFERYQALIEAHASTAGHPNDPELANAIQTAAEDVIATSDEVVALRGREADLWEILDVRTAFEDSESTFLSAIDEALNDENAELIQRQDNVATDIANSTAGGLLLAAISLSILLIASNVLYRSINRPLKKLQLAANELSRGRLDVRTGIDAKDELGQLATTLDHMANDLEVSITELEEQTIQAVMAREQAERSDSVKSQFLASVSHELRTPLNAILGFAEILRDGGLGPLEIETISDYASNIHQGGSHLLAVIDDLLDLAKIEAGRMELELEPLDVAFEIQNCLRLVAQRATNHGLSVSCELDPALPRLTADRRALRQILFNLLSNAIKFTPSGGKIVLSARRGKADTMTIAVADTGMGIAAEEMGRVFEPFRRTKASERQGIQGTGLGLPLVKAMVEQHGGQIAVTSEPGEGTVVTLTLPLTPTDGASEDSADPRQASVSAA